MKAMLARLADIVAKGIEARRPLSQANVVGAETDPISPALRAGANQSRRTGMT